MSKIEIDIPERLEMQIAQLIEEDEYIDRQEAIEDLISIGIRTLRTSGRREEDEFEESGFEDTMGGDDEYAF
jgi:Arc/MetJ-type ribon-helix-helix transcriptional regulator